LGVNFSYLSQSAPNGLAEALLIAENWLSNENCCLILGDNIFHGSGLGRALAKFTDVKGAQIFAQQVSDPERYGVVEFDEQGLVLSLEEKPSQPKSRYAVPGLYFFDSNAPKLAKQLKPSERGELEITDLNKLYLEAEELKVEVLPRGTAWLDTGTIESLNDASNYIRIIEERHGEKVSCLEEVAWRMNWISDQQLGFLASQYGDTPFGDYLAGLIN
jgi:glucose-1-phosphate thymidylyltransferase